MRSINNIILASVLGITTAGTAYSADGFTNFCYGSLDAAEQTTWGTEKLESYDVAMHISASEVVGMSISRISIPVVECEGIDNYSIWMSSDLKLENKTNAPDIASYTCSPENGILSVELATPYIISENGVYVGFSFTINTLGDKEKQPIVASTYTRFPESFYIHTNRSYKAWKNLWEATYISPVIDVVINGDFPQNTLSVRSVKEVNVGMGNNVNVNFAIQNNGGNMIDDIEYVLKIKDGSVLDEQTIALTEPIQPIFYGSIPMSVTLAWEKISQLNPGNYPLEIEIIKVNGVTNESDMISGDCNFNVLTFLPTHRPLLEEYTGLWCGYCPRGYVGLEVMNHLYPDEFIGVSYHGGDDMEVVPLEDYANPIIGYPDSWLDRVEETDAYSGRLDGSVFGMGSLWEEYREKLAPADINIVATFSDEELSGVNISAETVFAKVIPGETYSHVYMLIGNGMKKINWVQANYYAGENTYDSSPYYEFWEPFVTGSGNVRGLVYNDILLATTPLKGEGHELPETLEINKPVSTSHSFKFSEVVNVNGEEIVQDKNQLYVVVILLNNETGAVENANKVKVTSNTAIPTAQAAAEALSSRYYDLTGREISSPEGLCVKRTVYSDGSVKVTKIMECNR